MENKEKGAGFYGRPVVCLFSSMLACALWGSLYSVIKTGYRLFEIDTSSIASLLLFAGLRFLVCGAVLVAAAGVKEKHLRLPSKANILPILAVAFFAVILNYAFTYVGLSVTNGSKTSVLKQVGYLLASCFSFVFQKDDRFSVFKMLGGVLAFLGMVMMNLNGGAVTFYVGDLLILLASLSSAGGNAVCKKLYRTESPLYVVAWSQLTGGVLLTAAGLFGGGCLRVTGAGAVLVFLYICAASVLAYLIWNLMLKHNPLSIMSIYKFWEPLFGTLLAVLILHENIFDTRYLISFLLMPCAIGVSRADHLRGKKKNEGSVQK